MATKRKLNVKSYEEKYSILKFMDENPTWKKKDIAAKFNMKSNTLSDVIKNREKIMQAVENPSDARKGIKRMKQVTFDDVDLALITWFRQKVSLPELHLDGEMLFEKAKYFAKEFGHDAVPSVSWIDRFKKRYGIGKILKAGEAGGVDDEVVQSWKEGKLSDILHRYEAKDIYNCDETGLFWKMLPEKSLGFVGTSYHGSKQQKNRITVLVCANMDGSDKIPLLVIGKSKRPRAFKNVNHLPVAYEANKRAWMTGALFETWLRKLDRSMEGRKIAMIVDNCPAHPKVELENIEVVFLPPNTTSITQPMDGGIIKNMKLHYRHILAFRRLKAAEEEAQFKWDLLDAVSAVKLAWDKVSSQTISNVYAKVGFVTPRPHGDAPDQAEVPDDELNVTEMPGDETNDTEMPDGKMNDITEPASAFRGIWERLADLFPVPTIDQYVDIDAVEECTEVLTDEQIVEMAHASKSKDEESETEEDGEPNSEHEQNEPKKPPTMGQVCQALDIIRQYNIFEQVPDNLAILVDRYESFLMSRPTQQRKQSTITDFFKAKE
ncbi:tigger transposable element-derived protein 4-like [Diadema antillarum]|uniref:tigger transposable element-derived protein 4-like n=1 Tax=Diadema antillarum TaxID=105358 RepID=UPI003A892602